MGAEGDDAEDAGRASADPEAEARMKGFARDYWRLWLRNGRAPLRFDPDEAFAEGEAEDGGADTDYGDDGGEDVAPSGRAGA